VAHEAPFRLRCFTSVHRTKWSQQIIGKTKTNKTREHAMVWHLLDGNVQALHGARVLLELHGGACGRGESVERFQVG
jgi:hypothetical protein